MGSFEPPLIELKDAKGKKVFLLTNVRWPNEPRLIRFPVETCARS